MHQPETAVREKRERVGDKRDTSEDHSFPGQGFRKGAGSAAGLKLEQAAMTDPQIERMQSIFATADQTISEFRSLRWMAEQNSNTALADQDKTVSQRSEVGETNADHEELLIKLLPAATRETRDDAGSDNTQEAERLKKEGRAELVPCSSARALYDFEGSQHDELTIRTGDWLKVMAKHDDGWVSVQNGNGALGVVPGNYLEVIDEKVNEKKVRAQAARARYLAQEQERQQHEQEQLQKEEPELGFPAPCLSSSLPPPIISPHDVFGDHAISSSSTSDCAPALNKERRKVAFACSLLCTLAFKQT